MINTVQIEKKAIELRRSGFSYADIAKELKVSKTSVSNWVKNVRLTENEKGILATNLISKMRKGRLMASISIRARKVYKDKISYENAEKDFQKYQKDPLFLIGLGLYLDHGMKKDNQFHFSNSDVRIIKIMLNWLKKYLNLSPNKVKYRLFIQKTYKNEHFEEFWKKSCAFPATSLLKTTYLNGRTAQKSSDYRGSLTIIVTNIHILRQVIAWQKLAIRYYS